MPPRPFTNESTEALTQAAMRAYLFSKEGLYATLDAELAERRKQIPKDRLARLTALRSPPITADAAARPASSEFGRFPFGRPVLPCRPRADGPRRLFILGAYPSALHVAWKPPAPFRPIRALAVDNEPEPFWNGGDEERRVAEWVSAAGFDERRWGSVRPVGALNGSSGRWVEENVLAPLGVDPGEAWMTDCLDTYRCSPEAAKRIEDTYAIFAKSIGLPPSATEPHPNNSSATAEEAIFHEALARHTVRLKVEIAEARPTTIVTLGNAALRYVVNLLPVLKGKQIEKLYPEAMKYGQPLSVRTPHGETAEWIPLAHPGAPGKYQEAHRAWMQARGARATVTPA